MSELRETYNRIANDWHKDHSGDDWWKAGADAFAALLPERATILEIGCGPGHTAKYFVRKGLRVTGTDISDEMISIAAGDVPEARFFVLDIYEADTVEETFDAVYAKAVLLHMPKKDIPRVLSTIRRALKPGGFLYVAVKEQREGKPEEEVLTEDDYGYEYSRFFSYFTLAEMLSYVRLADYGIVRDEITSSGNTNWIQIIAQRPL